MSNEEIIASAEIEEVGTDIGEPTEAVEVQAETSMGVAFGDFYKEIDLLNLQSGVYLFRLNRNGNYYKKVFIKR